MSNNTVNKFIMPNGDEIKIDSGSGLELCDIGISLYIDETKGLRRYLNGQIVDINANTQAFLNRLLEIKTINPDNFTTEDNWQAEALLNVDGCVYKFVLNYADDGETVISIRLPKYPDYVEINAGGTLPVYGNGGSINFTDGNLNYGFTTSNTSKTPYPWLGTSSYGHALGTSHSGSQITGMDTSMKSLGLTTDPTKSGIQTTLKQTKLKLRYFIQIATGSETEANIVNTLENVNGFTLFESKYSDKPLYNESWLLSNGQWNAKAVYPTAYEGLQVEYNTEIEAGTTVTLPSGVSYTKRGLSVKLSTETYTDYDFVLNTADETFRLPLKTKQKFYDDIAPVVGNGIALGLNAGSLGDSALSYNSSSGLTPRAGQIGQNAGNTSTSGTIWTDGSASSSYNYGVGVTTNPTKSGIETHLTETTLYLYFYVGDIDQNHGIVNMGRIGEVKADRSELDGNWIFSPKTFLKNITITSHQVIDVDISSILPNDGNLYELIITADYSIPAGANNQGALSVYSDVWTSTLSSWLGRSTNTASGIIGATAGQCMMLVGASRILHFRQNATNDIIAVYARIIAYRKVR